ncbi:MAG TPA: redoxin domain-containing protein [Fimbriimonadaceae bacterium]|nr:redoxin domain-containing protein [Fimbriimonadaceae bacterium]
MKAISIAASLALAAVAMAQDKPERIADKDLPPSAVCAVCVTLGSIMTPAQPVAGVRYHGKRYFFHSKGMLDQFMKDPDAYSDPVLPRPMPKFDLTSDGTRYDAGWFKGNTVLVDFWATWCEPCRRMFPVIDDLYRTYRPHGLEVLSVSEDQKKVDFDKFVKATPFPNPVLFDSNKAFAAWHVTTIPAYFLVKDGHILAQWVGVTAKDVLQKQIEAALGK